MKIFTNKNLIQKLIIVIVAVTLLNFCIAPMQVQAAGPGGWLANGARDLAMVLFDGVISIAQYAVTGTWIDAVERGASAGKDAKAEASDFWQTSVKYPIIQLSPELIFSDEIELLSIDFINGGESRKDYIIPADGVTKLGSSEEGEQSTGDALSILRTIIATWYVTLRTLAIVGLLSVLVYIGIRIIISSTSQDKAKYKERLKDWVVAFCLLFFMHYIMAGIVTVVNKLDSALSSGLSIGTGIPLNEEYGNIVYNKTMDYLSVTTVQDKTALDAAEAWFGNNGYTISDKSVDVQRAQSSGGVGIKKWTYTLKKQDEKLKYKIEIETEIINSSDGTTVKSKDNKYTVSKADFGNGAIFYKDAPSEEMKALQTAINAALQGTSTDNNTLVSTSNTGIHKPLDNSNIKNITETTNSYGRSILVSQDAESTGSTILYYINYARLYCNANSDHNPEGFGFTMIYIILVVMTVMFLFRYLKRVIYVAFLTLIAPLVALTYPIDKIKDGKAQAFNMWIREYIFNVLIQPFHLLIYGILVGGASALASTYWIYGVVCIAFLIPAEKLLRKFFGFDNAGTLSAAGSFAGGALFSTMLNRINRPKPKGGNGGSGSGDRNGKINMKRPSNTKNQVGADDITTDVLGGNNTNLTLKAPSSTNSPENGINGGGGTLGSSNPYARSRAVGGARGGKRIVRPLNRSQNTVKTVAPQTTSPKNKVNRSNPDAKQRLKNSVKVNNAPKQNNSTTPSKPTVWKRLRQNSGNMLDAWADHKKRQIKAAAKEFPKNAVRFAGRTIVGGMAGGALALTGAAVGAASGDAGAAMKLATAGAAAGYYGANYYRDKVGRAIEDDFKAMEPAYWGSDYKAHQQEMYDEQMRESEEYIQAYANVKGGSRIDGKELSEEYREDEQFLMDNAGISDPKTLALSIKVLDDLVNERRTFNGQNYKDNREGARRIVAVAASKAAKTGASVWEDNSDAHRTWIKEEKEYWKKMGAKNPEDVANEMLGLMGDIKFGPSK